MDEVDEVRRKTALAFGIAEWANARDHLNALVLVGERVPRWVIMRIESELNSLVDLWLVTRPRGMRKQERIDYAVDEVGQWLVDHQEQLNEILEQESERTG